MLDIPKRFANASFHDFEKESNIRNILDEYLENFTKYYEEGIAPMFMGSSGIGKSRAAAALLNAISTGSNERISVAWSPISESLNLLLDARDMKNYNTYQALLHGIMDADVCVMDDFTTLRDSPRLKEYFWMLLDRRYTEKKSTILTANFDIMGFQSMETVWENIASHFGVPFVRRIREQSKGLTLVV